LPGGGSCAKREAIIAPGFAAGIVTNEARFPTVVSRRFIFRVPRGIDVPDKRNVFRVGLPASQWPADSYRGIEQTP